MSAKIPCFLIAALLPFVSVADTFDFRVVYADVPASEQVRAGHHKQAIRLLEKSTSDPDVPYTPGELSTLCALYVVYKDFENATRTCDKALRKDRSNAAFNNRGVLRVHLGDIEGAKADFDRARIRDGQRDEYIATLLRGDARLIATGNFEIVTDYAQRLRAIESRRKASATIEDVVPDQDKEPGGSM